MAPKQKVAILLIATISLCLASAGQSPAQILAPKEIEAPLPEKWRIPLAQYLRALGTPKVDELLESTRTMAVPPADILILRIEHVSACARDLCMTIIGELKDDAISSAAVFYAGKWMTQGDVLPNLLGTSFPPPALFFTSKIPTVESKYVALVSTPRGWIFSGGPN